MTCQELKEIMDSYLGDELLIETNHEVLRHLENCAACRAELAARRDLLTQMRSAVKTAPEMQLNSAFAARLHDDLRRAALRPSFWENFSPANFNGFRFLSATAAAALLLAALFGILWLRRPVPETAALGNQNQQITNVNQSSTPAETPTFEAVEIARREITETAVGDHKNCALKFNLAEKPISLAEAAEKYSAFYKDLDTAVKTVIQDQPLPSAKTSGLATDKIKFLEAHSCVFNGRRFAHIVLKRGPNTISLLIADADSPDQGSGVISEQTIENFQVAQFRAGRHAGFVVSDLSASENSAVAQMLLPAVSRHMEQAEA